MIRVPEHDGNITRTPTVSIIVINRDRPELADQVVDQIDRMGAGLEKSIYVVECGSRRPEGCSRRMTHWFRDPGYRGRYYGFHRGLEIARLNGKADFYWFVVNDISFPDGQDVLAELVGAMNEDPKMGLIGPGEPEADDYEGCHPKPGRRWHKVATVHGLAHLIRGEVIDTVGYMNPAFRYSQGAGAEYAYKLYRAGWFLSYSDVATLHHAGSSTYGIVTKISRHEYHRRARKFATRYLEKTYGANWDELFSSALPPEIETNMFPKQKEIWGRELQRDWKEVCPWFWSLGSMVKKMLRN